MTFDQERHFGDAPKSREPILHDFQVTNAINFFVNDLVFDPF
jgi:hypothetical protein